MLCVMWCAWDVTRDASAQYLHTGACQFHAMIDAESDASCQAPWTQNNPQPSVPQPQPSVQMPSRYMKEMMEQPEESDGPGDCVMLEKHFAPSVPRARSRSPRRRVGEPQALANVPALAAGPGRMYDHLVCNAKMSLQSQPQLTMANQAI